MEGVRPPAKIKTAFGRFSSILSVYASLSKFFTKHLPKKVRDGSYILINSKIMLVIQHIL